MADNGWASTRIDGLSDLKAQLTLLPQNVAKNVLRGATAAGAAVIRKEARLKAPTYTGDVASGHPPPGTLKKSIYQKQIRELSSLVQQTFYVGVRIGKNLTDKLGRSIDAFYWRFVEFGTSKMSARPFLRAAFEAKKLEAVAAIKNYLLERIPRELDKIKGPMRWLR